MSFVAGETHSTHHGLSLYKSVTCFRLSISHSSVKVCWERNLQIESVFNFEIQVDYAVVNVSYCPFKLSSDVSPSLATCMHVYMCIFGQV